MKIPHAGAINQIAYVVPDIDAAVRWWAEVMGVGPFLALRDLEFETSDYKGQDRPVTYSAAIAYSGDLNVELIEPKGPSIFADWLEEGRQGVQHICVFTQDFDATVAEMTRRGATRLQGGKIGGGSLGYYDMTGDQSVILEIAQLTPISLGLFDMVKNACANWDGETLFIEAGDLIAQATSN